MSYKITPIWNKDKIKFNNKDLPSSLRMLIIGPSGSGKTILLLKMLIYNLDYDKLVICSPSLDCQKEYQIFIKALNSGLDLGEIEQLFRCQDDIDDIEQEIRDLADIKEGRESVVYVQIQRHQLVTIYKDPELMPSPEELRKQFTPIN